MTMETERAEQQPQPIQDNSTQPAISELESRSLNSEVIDKLMTLKPTDPAYPLKGSLENNYSSSNDYDTKYVIARSLVDDGRYPDPQFLLKRFIPSGVVSAEEANDLQDENAIKRAKELKDRLQLLLVEKGHIKRGSREDDEAKQVVINALENRSDTHDLVEAGWPIEVIGQIMTVDLFSNVSDAKKLEELRSWVTQALMRPYLGVLKGTSPQKEMGIMDMMDRIPKRIFKDEYTVRYNLVQKYLEERLSRVVTDEGLSEGMVQIEQMVEACEDPEKKRFLENTYERFYDIATFKLEGEFKSRILVKGQERQFPSFEQRTFTYDFINHNTRLLAAETGLGKTNAAYLTMENSDATQVLVLAPATGKETWEIEANVAFQDPNVVHIIKGSADLPKAATSGKKYVVLSQQLLQDAENDPALMAQIEKTIIHDLKTDGLIIDEIDNFSNHGAVSSQASVRLAELIRQNHKDKTGSDNAPAIGLTATPIGGKLANMNVPMAILYPDEYVPSHAQSTPYKKTFSDTHLNRPDLVYTSLVGEKRMFRWEQATGVQEFKYEPLHIQASAFEEFLCYFIASEVETGSLNKIRLLEDALLNPLIIKVEVRSLAPDKIPSFDIDEALTDLKLLVREWKNFRGTEMPTSEEDFLSADMLVKLGKGDLVLGCFFSDLLEDGIDTLVEELTNGAQDPELIDLRKFWMSRELSTKYQVLKERIENALEWKQLPDGRVVRKKVSIVSPSKRQGRTGDVLQRATKLDEEGNPIEFLYAKYELDKINDTKLLKLVKEWVDQKGLCDPENVLMIDGTVNVGRPRNAVISRWVNDPDASVMVSTLEATYQSRDYTLNKVVDEEGREIIGVEEIHVGPPWHYRRLKQRAGRQQRQGQLVPLETIVLEAQNLIDQGKGEAVVYTYLLTRMALSGIVLSPEDQAFFDSKRLGNRIEFQSKEARFLRDALSIMTGAGEERMLELFESNLVSPERFAEKFFDGAKDEFHITGYNAELVSQLIKHTSDPDSKILSLGAGSLLLQRKLKRGIDNLDINPFVMQQGWELAKEFGGRTIQGRASALEPETFSDSSYDFVDLAYTLHMSKLNTNGSKKPSDSERVKILAQVNRVLKDGGHFSITTQEKSFDDIKFQKFTKAMEKHFGFEINQEYSGWSFGLGKPRVRKRLGWSVFMSKTGNVNLDGLDLSDLEFLTDSREWRSEWPKTKRDKSVVVPEDYPTAALKVGLNEFEIVNPNNLGEKVILSDSNPSQHIARTQPEPDEIVLISPEEPLVRIENISLDFLRGASKQDYRDYRTSLIKPIAKITGWNWTQIENFCIKTMQELSLQGRFTDSRLSMFSLLTREARRQISNNSEGVNY